jgi:hypothetical protein
MNVSQRPCDEESFQRVVCTWVDSSMWDHRSSLNSHALAIYLKFVPVRGVVLERFEECQCEDDDIPLHCQTWVPSDGQYRWLWRPINPLFMEDWIEYLVCTIRCILDFLQLWFIPSKSFIKL